MLKKIPTAEVRVGMYLHELSGSSWINHPFWKTKFVLKDQADLERLVNSPVTEVWIDAELGLDVAPPAAPEPVVAVEPAPEPEPEPQAPAPAPPLRSAPKALSIEQEAEFALNIKHRAKEEIGALFKQARLGQAVSAKHLAPMVEEISTSVLRNPGVFTSLARLKNKDDYTYLHSVTVCALMVSLGRQLGLNEEELRDAGMAGLLHDLGKAMIPLDVLNKPGKLTDGEFAVVKNHPRDGHDMLLGDDSRSTVAARDVALHHHEKMNGTGYPERLPGAQISRLARMAAICDVYDAITSNRPYKAGWDPSESIRRMATWTQDGHFDPHFFQAFVRSVGIYPTGSLVRLQSGRLAVVLDQNPNSALTPRVKAFFSIKSQLHIAPEIIDLAQVNNRERIVGRELPEDWNIHNLQELWTGRPPHKDDLR